MLFEYMKYKICRALKHKLKYGIDANTYKEYKILRRLFE